MWREGPGLCYVADGLLESTLPKGAFSSSGQWSLSAFILGVASAQVSGQLFPNFMETLHRLLALAGPGCPVASLLAWGEPQGARGSPSS